jgi:hypothetical protein
VQGLTRSVEAAERAARQARGEPSQARRRRRCSDPAVRAAPAEDRRSARARCARLRPSPAAWRPSRRTSPPRRPSSAQPHRRRSRARCRDAGKSAAGLIAALVAARARRCTRRRACSAAQRASPQRGPAA